MATKVPKPYLQEKNEILAANRFQEQCFLVRNIESLQTKHQAASFKNFVQIEDEPGLILNLLLGKGNASFMNILPSQMSILVPKIKIFKVFQDKDGKTEEEEISFPTFTDKNEVEQILQNKSSRGDGCGIKSFSWHDNGTNPADSGFSFTAKLEMYFQSVKAFFSKQEKPSGRVISYSDLVSYPLNRKLKDDDLYNENYFSIKAEVGWALPPDNELTLTPGLREAIRKTTTVFVLNLISHDIDFKENGTLSVSTEYIASIEGKMFSPEADIFYVKNRPVIQDVAKLDEQIEEATEFLNETRKKITDKPTDEQSNNLTLAEKALSDFISQKTNILRQDRAKSYGRLFQKLQDRRQLYFADVDCEEIGITANGVLSEDEQIKRNTERASQKTFNQGVSVSNNVASAEVIRRFQQAQEKKDDGETKAITEEQDKLINASISPLDQSKIRINYFYFGDLIDAALDAIYENTPSNNLSQFSINRDNFRVLLGSLEFLSPHSNKRIRVSLADIPISLTLYNSWFLDAVVRPLRDKFSLKEFITSICSKLILRCLNPVCFGSNFKNENVFTVESAFTLGGDYPEFDPKNGSRISIKDVKTKSQNKEFSSVKNYLYLGMSGFEMSHGKPDKAIDESFGVYHFYVGADRGLLKNVKFSRVNVPFLREMAIAEAAAGRSGDVVKSEPYNAKVVLFGNSFFKPGMKIYIDPLSLGFGTENPTDSLRIGGYYDIIKVESVVQPGKFETLLDCTAQNILRSTNPRGNGSPTRKIGDKV